MSEDEKKYQKRRKIVSFISLGLFLAVIVFLTVLFSRVLMPYLSSTEALHDFLQSYGWQGRGILLLLQCLQVFVAFIPGEVVELGAGYAYGAVEGALICLIGVALSSSLIFLLTKKVGIRLVEAFISREKIAKLRFINTEKRLKRTIFLLFLIPGTPKDVLTYFAGLTKISLAEFLLITLIARIPSVISSTICGQFLGKEDYFTAAIVYTVTGVFSIMGYLIYNRYVAYRQKKNSPKN